MIRHHALRRLALLGAVCLLPAVAGCNWIGAAAQLTPPPNVDAAYKGLKGQTVAVMVYADAGTRLDFPSLRRNLADAVQAHLNEAAKKSEDLKGTQFLDPRSVVRFQDDHPELEGRPLETAARLGVTRVIYVEVVSFDTHSPETTVLLKGTALGNVQVIEVPPDQQRPPKAVYTESNVRATYPDKAPEGLPADMVSPDSIYRHTVAEFAQEIGFRFHKYSSEDRT